MERVFESVDVVSPEDFRAFAVTQERRGGAARYELVNGRIVMTPPAGWPHGRVESELAIVIGTFVKSNRLGSTFGSSQGFELPTGDTLEPDHSFVSNERWAEAPAAEVGRFLRVVPDLVVEILSPQTASRDRGEKRSIYERSGVRELWLVDPRLRRVMRFWLADGRFDEGAVFDDDAGFESMLLPGLRFPVADLFPR